MGYKWAIVILLRQLIYFYSFINFSFCVNYYVNFLAFKYIDNSIILKYDRDFFEISSKTTPDMLVMKKITLLTIPISKSIFQILYKFQYTISGIILVLKVIIWLNGVQIFINEFS